MRQGLEPEEEVSFLRNPIVLGALAVVVVLLVVAVALILVGGGEGDDAGEAAAPGPTRTERPEASPVREGRVSGEVIATINVRSGPGEGYTILGTIRNGTRVEVVGRTEEDEWLQVIYPPQSTLHGWVDAAFLDLEGDPSTLAVATVEALPMPEVPTEPAYAAAATPTTEESPTPEGSPTEEPSTSPTAVLSPTPEVALPDLVIAIPSWLVDGTVVITVVNQGKGTVENEPLDVGVFDSQGQTLLQRTSAGLQSLAPGASIDISTGFTCTTHEQEVLIVVDVDGRIDETDNTNNQAIVTVRPCPGVSIPTVTPSMTPASPATAEPTLAPQPTVAPQAEPSLEATPPP